MGGFLFVGVLMPRTRSYQVGKYRWSLELSKGRGFFRDWGFALTTDGGHLGYTYREPGRDMSRHFNLTLIKWTFTLHISWKDLSEERKRR